MTAIPFRRPLVPEDLDPARILHEQRRALDRALAAEAIAGLKQQSAAAVLRRNWPGDELASLIFKAAAPPLGTDNFPATSVTSMDVLSLIAPASAATQLFRRCLRLDL